MEVLRDGKSHAVRSPCQDESEPAREIRLAETSCLLICSSQYSYQPRHLQVLPVRMRPTIDEGSLPIPGTAVRPHRHRRLDAAEAACSTFPGNRHSPRTLCTGFQLR